MRIGSRRLGEILMQKVGKMEGSKPYFIPVGGSNAIGTWGYLESFQEILQQAPKGEGSFTDIVMVSAVNASPLGTMPAGNPEISKLANVSTCSGSLRQSGDWIVYLVPTLC